LKTPSYTGQFKKDRKTAKKRGYDLNELDKIIEKLLMEIPLPPENRDHTLSGNYANRRECHIAPDWLLIYFPEEKRITFERTGTHSDLF